MQFKKENDDYFIRLEREEKLIETLTFFCKSEGIKTAFVNGLGSISSAELGYYDLNEKEYIFKSFSETHEISSLTGNVAIADNSPFIHLHCVLSNNKFECFGGHLKEGIVEATCEIYMRKFDLSLERKLNEEIGLKLLDCGA